MCWMVGGWIVSRMRAEGIDGGWMGLNEWEVDGWGWRNGRWTDGVGGMGGGRMGLEEWEVDGWRVIYGNN